MKMNFISLLVDDQQKALEFYTEILGFKKMADIPFGDFRWLTVIAPDGHNDIELVLEPMNFPPAKEYQKSLFEANIPANAFTSLDIFDDYKKLSEKGVKFRSEPRDMGVIYSVLFEDTCGNLINLVQVKEN